MSVPEAAAFSRLHFSRGRTRRADSCRRTRPFRWDRGTAASRRHGRTKPATVESRAEIDGSSWSRNEPIIRGTLVCVRLAREMPNDEFRRKFLARSGQYLALTLASPFWTLGQSPRGQNPFTLGVASGDPAPDGALLWTRLAPD